MILDLVRPVSIIFRFKRELLLLGYDIDVLLLLLYYCGCDLDEF